MQEKNPYRPPVAVVRDSPLQPRSPTMAVLAGVAVATVGAFVVTSVILYVYGATGAQVGNPLAMWFIASTVAEGVFSLFGGYVCARMVRRNERRVTAILASLIAGADLALAAILSEWEWLEGMLLALTVVCVLAGGELGRRRNLADAREANAATAA